ncbi:MAG: NAD(P)H-dependent oxidoreductase [Microcoleus vaginatus WJT46-NPBG5]|jgi:NAD(P)H-dependent FMN reductase|nr:NAD(P)H-dependent oxidoreductase [Microcoleus vaginatus WJT46-NPBG5]
MTYTPKILAFAGSTRRDSYNKKLVKVAAQGARSAGAEVTFLDLRDLPLPLYDEDLEAEQGIPQNALKLKELMMDHQGFLIASPEYNSSLSAVLKNAIDWASRPASPDEPMLACFSYKVAAIMSASPGGIGGMRGLVHLRSLLGNIKVIVLPDQVAVPKVHEAFNADGTMKDPQQQASIEKLGENVARMLSKLNG